MNKINYFFVLAISLATFLLLGITGTLNSGYHFPDDHEILRINDALHERPFFDVVYKSIAGDLHVRFRPFYYFHRTVETILLGTDIFKWSVYTGLLACLTFSFFFIGLRKLKFSILEALIFLLIAFIGPQMAIWWRLGPNETIGMTFLSISFFFLTKCLDKKNYSWWNGLFCLFLIFASLCKESFVVIIPAFIIFKIWNERNFFQISWLSAIKKNYLLSLPILGMLLELWIIIFYVGTNQIVYAGVDSNILATLQGLLRTIGPIKELLTIALLLGVTKLAISCFSSTDTKILFKKLLPLILPLTFCGLILVPNMILYAKSGMNERYLLPATIGIAFLVTALVHNILIQKWLKLVIVVFSLLLLFYPIKTLLTSAAIFADEGAAIQTVVKEIKANYNPNKKVLIVARPGIYYEASWSLKTYLEHNNIDNIFAYAVNDHYEDTYSQKLSTTWHQWFKNKEWININDEPSMIIFLNKSFISDYFKQANSINKNHYQVAPAGNSELALYIKVG